MISLEVRDLESGYGEVKVLWGLNLDVRKGELTAILGSNGSGKTTFLKTVMGVISPWNGTIKFNGEDVTKLSTHQKAEKGIIMVPEGRLVFPEMSVYENLEMGAYTKRARDKFDDSLEFVVSLFPRLKERFNQKAGTLSGGEQQMLAIARGLMSKPELFILDEPSLGLAPKLVIEVFETINKLREQGLTMLLVEQNVHLSLAITDYVYILSEGKIKMEGRGEELAESDEIRKAYLGV